MGSTSTSYSASLGDVERRNEMLLDVIGYINLFSQRAADKTGEDFEEIQSATVLQVISLIDRIGVDNMVYYKTMIYKALPRLTWKYIRHRRNMSNTLLMHADRIGSQIPGGDENMLLDVADDVFEFDPITKQRLIDSIRGFGPGEFKMLALVNAYGHTIADAARMIGINESTSYDVYKRAVDKLFRVCNGETLPEYKHIDPKADVKVYRFEHKDGTGWSGSRDEFLAEFGGVKSGVSQLLTGKLKTYKGWQIVG